MVLEFPELKSRGCIHFLACARVETDDATIRTWLAESRTLTATYKKRGVQHYVRMMTGGRKKDHFHLEVATKGYFSAEYSPKSTSTMDTVREYAAKLLDQKMHVSCRCTYDPAFADLPERGLIKAFAVEHQTGDTRMRLDSGSLTVTGMPVNRISWARSLETGTCAITLTVEVTSILIETYLTSLFDFMNSFYQASLLGKETKDFFKK